MTLSSTGPARIGAVLIGRNEGDRLVRCLASVAGQGARMVYVDSGSTDGSVAAAEAAGAEVVALDLSRPFTAARARNEGLARLLAGGPAEYVQFIDGDCELQPGWIETAAAFLDAEPDIAVVHGRRRERFPEASIYNQLCDWEWERPVGEAKSCGGDALMRVAAVQEVGGYNPALIAGEEPEMCVRLRAAGWRIWNLGTEMTLHDAAMTRFSQFWKRARRAGHAYAEGAAMHGAPPERHGVTGRNRALIWGAGLPAAILLAAIFLHPAALLAVLAYPAQIARLALRDGNWRRAAFLTLEKVPQAQGALGYIWGRFRGRRAGLIEYK
ncbi:MAG: glycosyltransferase family A protein [Pseudomonadota bacterium]